MEVDKRTKEYRESLKLDYGKVENNPGWKLCMKCGRDTLPPNEDGTQKYRKCPEACDECVKANLNRAVYEGKEMPLEDAMSLRKKKWKHDEEMWNK